MHPILIKLGPISIFSYGVMVAAGFGLAAVCIYMRAPKFGLDKNKAVDLVVIVLVSGVIGARLLFILLNLDYYIANPPEILNLSKGGLVWYGGFLSAFLIAALYIKKKRLDLWAFADLIMPYVALAQAFGRIGCFLNGCCYGIEVPQSYPLAVLSSHDYVWRCPTQLYSAVAMLVIFVLLRLWQSRRHFIGEIFLGYCILYSYKRFLMEFLRGDNPRIVFALTMSQAISLVILIISLAAFLYKVGEWKKTLSPSK